MEIKDKKGLIHRTLERCRSIGSRKKPKGCMAIYVGPGKERFVIRTDCINHPLFRELLEEAEAEYGYARDGPIELPCDVGHFERVLWEMDEDTAAEEVTSSPQYFCSLPASPSRGGRAHTAYRVLTRSPTSRVVTRPVGCLSAEAPCQRNPKSDIYV